MKKRLTKIVIALLVFAFVVGVGPTGVIADMFNNVVDAAEQSYNLQKVDGIWRYYNDAGDLDLSYVGLAKNEYGWWYVENGTIDFSYTGMAKNAYGWWHVKNGKLDLTYTGIDSNLWGSWYMKNGKLDTTFTGMAKDSKGWRYIKNGKVVDNYTGMAKNPYGWWYFQNGRINYNYVGLAKNEYGWWYIKNGTIDFNYTGLAKNQYGTWFVKKGKLDQTYSGNVKDQYGTWIVKNGKVVGKVETPAPEETQSEAEKQAGTLGFYKEYQDGQLVFYSAKDPWQRNFGYNAAYDWAAQLIVLYYDTVRIKFNYGGYDWLVEVWKGQYGFVLIGEELGVYYKPETRLIEHYDCVTNEDRLKAGYIAYDKGKVIFTKSYRETWWLTGFVEGKLDRFNDRSEMAMDCVITLKDYEMLDAFIGGMEKAGFTAGKGNIDEPDTYYVDGLDVHFFWQYLNEMR